MDLGRFAIVINEQGFKVGFVMLSKEGEPRNYTLKEGETLVEDKYQDAIGMFEPRWVENEWIETAEPVEQPEKPLSDVEILQGQMLDSYMAQAELYETTITQEEQIMDSYMAQAELYELVLTMQQEIETLKQSKN